MSSSIPLQSPPAVPPERYGDLAGRTEALAQAFTADPKDPGAGWIPPAPAEMDLGRAIIRVFDRMARQVVDRVDRMPDRAFLAFLDRIGVEPAPARAARVPLTFSLVQQSGAEPIVPAATRVGAKAAPGDTREVVLGTEIDLPTTRAQLSAVIVQQPDGDRLGDATAAAIGATQAFFGAFDGSPADTVPIAPSAHSLYLAADEVLGLPAGTSVTVAFTLDAGDVARWKALHATIAPLPKRWGFAFYVRWSPDPPLVQWRIWNGADWVPLAFTASTDTSFTFAVPPSMPAVAVNGQLGRWLRADLIAWPAEPIPAIKGVTLTGKLTLPAGPPDLALSGSRPVDLSLDFYPLGEQPRLNDALCLSCDRVLSRPGATVTVAITRSAGALDPTAGDAPKITWEMTASTASGWKPVSIAPTAGFPATVTFTVPAEAALASVGGTKATWLRARLSGGSFGKGMVLPATVDPRALSNAAAALRSAGAALTAATPTNQTTINTAATACATAANLIDSASAGLVVNDGYRPPIFKDLALSGSVDVVSRTPTCVLQGDLAFTTFPSPTPAQPLVPFVRGDATDPAIYLGFDRAPTPGDAMLYVQVAPLRAEDAAAAGAAGAPPQVVWEVARGAGWEALPCDDETRGFATGGLLRFVAPTGLGPRSLFGQSLVWLRARLVGAVPGASTAAIRLGRILTNTVWASDAVVVGAEVLGSADGGTGQTFTLSGKSVLAGQSVEVDEGAAPPDDERAAVEALEGADAVTVLGDPQRPDAVWVRWHEVPDLLAAGPRDRFYVIDRRAGTVTFGDGRRGLPPPRGRNNVRARYRAGGGADGNRAALTVAELKTTVPYVDGVTNVEPSTGGADRESLDRVKRWGPRVLRHGHRAVTAEDYEDLALAASADVARAHALCPSFDAVDLADQPTKPPPAVAGIPAPGAVVVLLVTSGAEMPPTPSVGLLRQVQTYLRDHAAASASLQVAGPDWVRVSIKRLTVFASTPTGLEALRDRIDRALRDFLHPITGGFDGQGWDFGALPFDSDIYRLVMAIPGVDRVGALEVELRTLGAGSPPKPTDPAFGRIAVFPDPGAFGVQVLAPKGA
jgi:hypothetical protein